MFPVTFEDDIFLSIIMNFFWKVGICSAEILFYRKNLIK